MKKIIAVMAVLITLFSMGNVSASAAAKVAALMYHSVTTDSSRWNDYTISPEQLDADIQYFKSCGYIPMTATELATANMADIDNTTATKKRIVLLITEVLNSGMARLKLFFGLHLYVELHANSYILK